MRGAEAHYLITRGLSACLVGKHLWHPKRWGRRASSGSATPFPLHHSWCVVVNQTRDTGLTELINVRSSAVCAWRWCLLTWASLGSRWAVCAPCRARADETWKCCRGSLCALHVWRVKEGQTQAPSTMWVSKAELGKLMCRNSQAWGGAPGLSGTRWVSAQAEGYVQGWDHHHIPEVIPVTSCLRTLKI